MSSPELPSDENNSSVLRNLAIAAGTVVVVALTVLAAIFLAMDDMPTNPTVVAVGSPSPTMILPTVTQNATIPPVSQTIAVPTDTPSATSTPSATLTASATPLPPEEPTNTPVPPTATNTLPPPPPTATPVPEIPTPTPVTPPPTGGACQPPPTWVTYEVQTGDTLNSLAERTDSSEYELYEVNCLESYTILPGQVIYLPFTPPTPTVTKTPTPVTPSPTPTRTGTPTATPHPPEISGNEPFEGNNTAEVIIAVQGRYFQAEKDGFRVELRVSGTNDRTPLALGELKTSSSFEAIVPAGLAPGWYDLWVINPDDQFDTRRTAYRSIAPSP